MSRLQNRVLLIGHVGMDPEIHIFPSGDKKATFRLATHRTYKDAKGEDVVETDWHTIVVFGKLTEVVETFVSKGKKLGIEGRLSYRSYNAPDGSKRNFTEIVCQELEFLDGASGKYNPPVEEPLEASK